MKTINKPTTYVVNAGGQVLGRVATQVADLLRGKNAPTFESHEFAGNTVVVLNMKDIRLTGNKLQDKTYYHHTRYPGGLKSVTAGKIMERDPADLMVRAVTGMLPKNKLRARFLKNLKVMNDDNYQVSKNDVVV